MSRVISFIDRLSIGASAIAWFLLAAFFLLGLPIVLAWPNPLLAIAGVISLVLAAVGGGVCWLFRRRRSNSNPLRIFVKTAVAAFMAAVGLTKHPASKIYVTYGAAHLPGVIALLKGQDPQWRVTSAKWMRAIGTPEHLSGRLVLQEGAR